LHGHILSVLKANFIADQIGAGVVFIPVWFDKKVPL